MNSKLLRPYLNVLLLFVLLNILLFGLHDFLERNGVDRNLLLGANLLLFIISSAGFFIQRRGLLSSNPQAFVRGVYLSLIVKMFTCMVVALIYIASVRSSVNKPGLFTAMGLYLIYTVVEVTALTKIAKKNNAG